jgi:signal transduction histidine kinase/DNA-binding response OmpR family regulator
MRYYTFIALLLFLSLRQATAQNREIDSLQKAYKLTSESSAKLELYYELAEAVLSENPEAGWAYADSLELFAKKAKDKKALSRAAYLHAFSLDEQGKYEEALPYHQQELAFAKQTTDDELLGKALNSVGYSFHNLGKNDSALVYLMRAAEIKQKLGNMKDVSAAYANIGNIYSDLKAPEKAVEWLEKALTIRLSLPEGEKSAIITYNNISIAYHGVKDYDKAIAYAQKGYDLAVESGNNFFAGVIAGTIGVLWGKKGELDKAIEMSERAVEFLLAANRRSNTVFPYANLSETWWRKGDFDKALLANQKGYVIMEELKLMEPLEVYYENFARIYESQGNYQQALHWYRKFMILDDSLFKKENLETVATIEAKFEKEKTDAQLARQELDLARQTSQKKTILIVGIVLVLGLLFLLQYLRYKQKQKQREVALLAQISATEAEKLKELDLIKSNFFANISHEFRTPLTLILSPIEQMASGTFTGDAQKYFRIIIRNGKRLLELVNQLLDLSKLESGKLKLQLSPGDLGQFVGAIAGSFESLAVRKEILFEVKIPRGDTRSYFDQDKLEKILVNLIANAFKFTSEGDSIVVEMVLEAGNARISVKDSGIGIPASQLPRLFERFTQSSPSDVQAGSGLGLALVKELVQLHKGEITVESEEGKGTHFQFMIPVNKAAFSHDEILTEEGVPKEATPIYSENIPPEPERKKAQKTFSAGLFAPSKKPLLLLVEDNPDLRSYISEIMQEAYQVIEAKNGKEAVAKAIETTPDLVITDVMMPEMDGIAFCKQLKTNEKTSHVPIIILTAKAEQANKYEGLEIGADDYMVKPFDAQELKMRAANLIRQRENLQQHFRRVLHSFTPEDVKVESMDDLFLQKIKEVIEAHLDDETFSVPELGHEIGMSRSQLHRKLSALTGFSPSEVIRNMRLERARQLLEQKAATVAEISYLCGFSSPAYFIKCFKDYFGTTPGKINI